MFGCKRYLLFSCFTAEFRSIGRMSTILISLFSITKESRKNAEIHVHPGTTDNPRADHFTIIQSI